MEEVVQFWLRFVWFSSVTPCNILFRNIGTTSLHGVLFQNTGLLINAS